MNIFIAKLHPSTDDSGLEQAFSAYGKVSSAKVIMDRETGRSKCFGFVEMPNSDEAKQALESLDGSQLDGNTIVAKESQPKERSDNRNRRFDKGRNNRSGGGGFDTSRW